MEMKRYLLLTLAVILLISGGIALYIGSSDPAIRPIGLGAVLISVLLVRTSNSPTRFTPNTREIAFNQPDGPSRSLKLLSLALVPVALAAFLLLMNDAAHGHHQILPVYIFAGVGIVCIAVWSYLASQSMR